MTVTVVGIGGSIRSDSQSERALRVALEGARELGAETIQYSGPELVLPFYDPSVPERTDVALKMVEDLRRADGVILVSPGYHGTVSGLVKNALDYIEDLRGDERPYLDGRAVGLASIAFGWQASVATLAQLRTITHSLRGWPTPLGGAINSAEVKFDEGGGCSSEKAEFTLRTIGAQVVEFARYRAGR